MSIFKEGGGWRKVYDGKPFISNFLIYIILIEKGIFLQSYNLMMAKQILTFELSN